MMPPSRLELWGGVECTVNRVGDAFFDQLERTGHAQRLDDLDLLKDLGIRKVRYPVLWERTAPRGLGCADFSWADQRMNRLRELGIEVIVGLVHHGSGPRSTHLLDDSFASGLAEFAGAVAQRYPWVTDYTCVNEPLTTARFSALYGHWYPHARTARTFVRSLLVETRATAQAMAAIRRVAPHARLIQTEDVGTVFSSSKLRYQAAFENRRRWLSLDLLYGKVDRHHPLFGYLKNEGASEDELLQLVDRPCPPDMLGINYYVTSDRFLDERYERYPTSCRGSNGYHTYADVEAVRVRPEGIVGHRAVLNETWKRYQTPMAITEAHLGCTPEEQIRWLLEVWGGAERAREDGADVRAVTLWSIFGAYDWDSLVVQPRGHYEPGAYDVRGTVPHPTALARVAKELAHSGESRHPLIRAPGWWRRPERLLDRSREGSLASRSACPPKMRPVLVTGAEGMLARSLTRACEERGLRVQSLPRRDLDITDRTMLERIMNEVKPWLVVNAAGVAHLEDAVKDPQRCHRTNAVGPGILAEVCRARGTRLLTFSSSHVFDGKKAVPYVEGDPLAPINLIGKSQAESERLVLSILPQALVVRVGSLFGPGDEGSIWSLVRRALGRGERVVAPDDCRLSPTYVPDLSHACLDLAVAESEGLMHVSHEGSPSVAEWLSLVAEALGLNARNIVPQSGKRTLYHHTLSPQGALSSDRAAPLPPLQGALERFARLLQQQHAAAS